MNKRKIERKKDGKKRIKRKERKKKNKERQDVMGCLLEIRIQENNKRRKKKGEYPFIYWGFNCSNMLKDITCIRL